MRIARPRRAAVRPGLPPLARPVLDPDDFFRRIAGPQILLLVILLAAGALFQDTPAALGLRVGALSFAGLMSILPYVRQRPVTLGYLTGAVAVLAILIIAAAILSGSTDPFVVVLVPILLLVAILSEAGLPVRPMRYPIGVSGGVGALGVLVLRLRGDLTGLEAALALGTLGAGALLALGRSRRLSRQSRPRTGRQTVALPQSAAREGATPGAVPVDAQLLRRWSRLTSLEVAAEYSWRLPLLALATGAMVLAAAMVSGTRAPWFGVAWILAALALLVLLRNFFRGATAAQQHRAALCIVVIMLLWWVLLTLVLEPAAVLPDALLVALLLGVSAYPWPRRATLGWVGLFSLLALLQLLSSPLPLGAILGTVVVLPIAVRTAARARLYTATRVGIGLLQRLEESSAAGMETLRALAWQLAEVADASGALLVSGEDEGVIIRGTVVEPSQTDVVFIRGLCHHLDERGGRTGGSPWLSWDLSFEPHWPTGLRRCPGTSLFSGSGRSGRSVRLP